ncbi:DUF2530 domain-containing protein [Actinokineospora sp. UTMC 2448]|uniref:DUF2530 domain-containing protein n=1 Tax=Actinokineospora sp. UTMC 2448 TaxID=2268449 RepID=UPI0021644918|nr:DUF2530 domain-containing protein [Actinokineospora sp. UTMC 2448]
MPEPRPDRSLRPPPPLPPRLLELGPIVYVGTGIWLVAALVMTVFPLGLDPVWRWTALAGAALGIVGAAIMAWQRRAAKSGRRGAQKLD